MSDLITALGLVLVIEGLIYAVNPDGLKKMMAMMHDVPSETLRWCGIGAVTLGFLIVWFSRSAIF
ncbi:MAG: DUF2065 domain-containing protein [Hyphomicrobiales bacterium]